MPVSARFALNTTYYTLAAERFGDIATEYPRLYDTYNTVMSEALAAKERSEDSLDYIIGKNNYFDSAYA